MTTGQAVVPGGDSAAVEFGRVCFAYGPREVLHNVSFTIDRGSLVGVVGPNGGGKTTLLKIMLGLLRPARGSVRVLESTPAAARRRVGYVMQHMNYDPQFPARTLDVVLMGRVERHGFGPYGRADREAALNALARVDLSESATRPFPLLSGGQQQRALIAQALVTEPQLLLLDEPTANIDPEGEQKIHRLLAELKRRMTIVVVSHNVNVVLASVSHVLCVNGTAVLNPIDRLHPTVVSKAFGSDVAVLHHELNCHVVDSSAAMIRPHAEIGGADEEQRP